MGGCFKALVGVGCGVLILLFLVPLTCSMRDEFAAILDSDEIEAPEDPSTVSLTSVGAVHSYRVEDPIGGGWQTGPISGEGSNITVVVRMPALQADHFMDMPIETMHRVLAASCCPGHREPLWQEIAPADIIIQPASFGGEIFADVLCRKGRAVDIAH